MFQLRKHIANIQSGSPSVLSRIALSSVFPILFLLSVATVNSSAQEKQNTVCPNPAVPCRSSSVKFKPHQLSFKVLRKTGKETGSLAVSASFYAVMLQSMASDHSNPEPKCASHIPEDERLTVQKLFPENKVFATRYDCGAEGDFFLYIDESRRDFDTEHNFMAVYAGETIARSSEFSTPISIRAANFCASIRSIRCTGTGSSSAGTTNP